MKLRSIAAAVAMVALSLTSWNEAAFAQEGGAGASCVNDIDCKANGTMCGTDVCDYGAGMKCVAAAQASGAHGSQGWCTANSDCKCMGAGATCVGAYCSFITPPAGGSSGSSSGGASSSGSGSSSGAASGDGSTASSSGGSSGGCTLAPVAPAAATGWGLAAATVGLAFVRRRQHKMLL